MSQSICLRCLARPLTSIEFTITANARRIAPFSTSAPLAAPPVKKKKGAVVVTKGKQYKQGKPGGKGAKAAGGGRPPAPGERKALRKRVVLSNTNALEVQGLEDFTVENALHERNGGQVLGFSNESVDALRAVEAFKPTQGWSLFRRPATLIRKDTVEMAQLIDGIEKKTVRKVLYGEKGSGKSVLQLQAMAMAFMKGWTVIHIPEAQELTIAHTSYVPQTVGNETIYIQPHYTASLLSAIARANHALLSTLQLSRQHDLPIPVQSNMSLARFAELGAQDPDIAWPIFQALWTELTSSGRPPIMFSLDSLNHVMRDSAYLAADSSPVHAHQLALVGQFMALLSGKESLPNGGMVIAATSDSNKPSSLALEHALRRNQALADNKEAPEWDAYVRADRRSLQAMEGVDVWQLKGLSKEEARGIMEYYAKSGILRGTVNDSLIGEKWTLSGGGIIGELERSTVIMRM